MKQLACLLIFFNFFTVVGAQNNSALHNYDDEINSILSKLSATEKIYQLSGLFGWEMYANNKSKVSASDKIKNMPQLPGMLWGTLRADPWTKISLLNGLTPMQATLATSALQQLARTRGTGNIPLLLAEEGAHGTMAIGATVFPTALGQASTFNTNIIGHMAEAIAAETRAMGSNAVYAPILDLARDPRWSRVEETFGEDPELAAQMGVAVVKGLQNGPYKVASTLKHFTAYGMSAGAQNGGPVTLGKRDLMENILYPFQAAVKSGAMSVMSSYNSIDGVPCSANYFLLTDVLRKQWGFNGFTVSDLGSINGIYTSQKVAPTPEAAAALALKAGLDADLGGSGFGPNLKKALDSGLVSVKDIDTALSRLLRVKYELGLFQNSPVAPTAAATMVGKPAHVTLALKIAQQSIILLKNDTVQNAPLLPLTKNVKRVAVIGPNADNMYNQIGDYSAPQKPGKVVTVLQGIRNKLPNAHIQFVKGCAIRDTTSANIEKAVAAATSADVAIVVLGGSSARDFKTSYENTGAAVVKSGSDENISDMESGEGYDRSTLDFLGLQNKLLQAIVATGKPVILVTIQGRPLNLNWAQQHVPAIVNAWYPGEQGGNALADVLFGDYNPAGRLPVSYPQSVGQLPVYYNHQGGKKHRYVEEEAEPLYPFGYGLSYSHFSYSNLTIKNHGSSAAPDVAISFTVKNNSNRVGDEVPQLYIRQKYASTVRPILQLRDFSRITLKAGESKSVQLRLTKEQLQNWTLREQWEVEKGIYDIMIGASSKDIRLKGSFEL